MSASQSAPEEDRVARNLYDLDSSDPQGELFDRSNLSPQDVVQIGRLMTSLGNLRAAEEAIREASEKYMQLSTQDMRALQYLIVARHRGENVTPGMIATFLGISPASTTKLLNRLEHGGHIVRQMHPTDRRALVIHITPETENSAKQTVGKQQAKRMSAATRLTPDERETVIRFLDDMAEQISITNAEWAQGLAAPPDKA